MEMGVGRLAEKKDKGLYATMKRWAYRPFIVSYNPLS